jgi:hypothetical protein
MFAAALADNATLADAVGLSHGDLISPKFFFDSQIGID